MLCNWGRRPCQTTGLRVRQHKRASQTTRVRQHRRASQTTETRESDNRHARVRQQKRANMTTKDNEGNGFTRAKCKQQQLKKEHGINKACGTAVGKPVTCDPIIRSLATLLYGHLRLYSSRNLAIASDPIIRSLAALLMEVLGGKGNLELEVLKK